MFIASQPIQFSGTGKDGAVKVAVAKASYSLDSATRHLEDQPGIELVGTASTPDEFSKLLQQQQPDVVVLGSTFGLGSRGRTPQVVLQTAYPPQSLPGVVFHSTDEPVQMRSDEKNISSVIRDDAPVALPTHRYVKTYSPNEGQNLTEAIRAVDPYPTGKPQQS